MTTEKKEAAREKPPEDTAGGGLQLNRKTLLLIGAALAAILIFAGILTQVVPRGAYQVDEAGQIINGTYARLTDAKLPFWRTFTAPIEVFASPQAATGIAIVLFIVLVGGTFLVLEKAGVISYLMKVIVRRYAAKKYRLLAVMTLVCMTLGSVAGILEESVTLVPLAAAIAIALGWDSLTGLGFSLVSIAIGYSAATFNPFNVVVVQSMAGLPLFSGLGYRLVVFAGFYGILLLFLISHAKRIEKNPEKSLSFETDQVLRAQFAEQEEFSPERRAALRRATKTFVGCISGVLVCAAVSFGVQAAAFLPQALRDVAGYLPMAGMAVLFTLGGVLAGRQAGFRGRKLAATFGQGVKTVIPIAPLIVFVMSITYLLQRGKIIDTLLHAVYEGVKGVSVFPALLAILALVVILEFFVGSGTAKAFLLMPLLLPLADLLGVTRQSVVLAFTLGDGICNILYPTSGVMIIAIGLIHVSYSKFLRWTWKLFLALFALTVLILGGAVLIGYH
ncbi:MAG: AbgT family transporter [Oscillospiraceae bacterium]|jgi:uncharacterized ion transporter superfamily protein YfcC|nr:AbgT family transporter [Oscillospiraceae bacterium]